MTYEAFLVALFAMAAGCSILETSANPYVMSLGSEATATRRLNLAQAFNPVGTNIGVLLASTLILPRLADPVDIGSLTPEQLHTVRAGELGAVMGPYIGLACLLDPHRPRDREPEGAADRRGVSRRRPARGRHARAVRRAVAQQALPLRRRRPVLERRGAGVHVDVPDRVRGAGAGRQPREGRRLPAGQPAGLPGLALSHDLGDRLHPRDPRPRGARLPRRGAVPVRDVEPEHGRRDRRRLAVLLPVADVPDDLRGRPDGPRAGDEVRGGRPRDGDRGWRDHAAGAGQARGRDERGLLVHRPRRLLRGRRALRALRPQGQAERDRRGARPRLRRRVPPSLRGPSEARRDRPAPPGRGGLRRARAGVGRVRRRRADERHDEHEAARGRVLVDLRVRGGGPGRPLRRVPRVEPGRRRRQRRGRRRRRLERDRRARQAPAGRQPARRLADVHRQVGSGLREPRRGPQRRVGLRQRAICARG